MNSNFSVTDGRGRSTPRLFSGSRSPSSVPGFPVRARAAAPAHSRSAAALRRHAHGGKRPPSYRGYPRLYRAPLPLWRSGATSRSPSSRLHPGIQERSSSSVEAITYLSRRPPYIGGTVRKPRGSSEGAVGGEHADQHVCFDPFFEVVVDGAQAGVVGLDVAEVSFQVGQVFVGGDDAGSIEVTGGYRGAQHVEAIEGGLGVDLVLLAGDGQAGVG